MPTTTKERRISRPIRCNFCGKELQVKLAELPFGSVFAGYEECDCEAAVAYRKMEQRNHEAARERARKEARHQRLSHAGIGARYHSANHQRKDEVVDAAMSGKNVYILGEVGTLKTTLASAATIALIDRNVDVEFNSMWRILDEIKSSFNSSYDPLPHYFGVKVLVLDDLGKEAPTDFALERLFALVDERYTRMLPTIVTTQYRPGQLIERLAEKGNKETAKAIVSRLRHDCLMVELEGGDRRLEHV